jgi:hypothetical protein
MNPIDAFFSGVHSTILRAVVYFAAMFAIAILLGGEYFPLSLIFACASWGIFVPIAWVLSILWIPCCWSFISNDADGKRDLFISISIIYLIHAPLGSFCYTWPGVIAIYAGLCLLFWWRPRRRNG